MTGRGLDFGTAAGVSPETIRNIETIRFEPAAETVRKITVAFAKEGIGFFDHFGGYHVAGGVPAPGPQ